MSKPRRQSFLKACQRISSYYDSMDKPFMESSTSFTKEQSIEMLKDILIPFDPTIKRTRSEQIQNMTTVFEILVESDELMRTHPRFRESVYTKINETQLEFKKYKKNMMDQMAYHVHRLQTLLSDASETMSYADRMSAALDPWLEGVDRLKEHTSRLEDLFNTLLERRTQYESI